MLAKPGPWRVLGWWWWGGRVTNPSLPAWMAGSAESMSM